MRLILGLVGLVMALAIVVLLARERQGTVVPRASPPASAPVPLVQQPAQVQRTVEALMQQPRPSTEEAP